ncbi:MAG: FG-GAP repeat protein [Planctomycetota bacterium]|nr:FG-GAP repeat protein [Planctomycetota bacterium]
MKHSTSPTLATKTGRLALGALALLATLAAPARAQTTEDLKLLASDGGTSDSFGSSVAISGDTAVIGAPRDDDNGSGGVFSGDSGAAYVFDLTTGQQVAKLLASDGADSDYFGCSLAIGGHTVLIGAWGDDNEIGIDGGAVYVFDLTTGLQTGKLMASDGEVDELFGMSVAISEDGDTALVGAKFAFGATTVSGAVYVFDVTTGQQTAKLIPSDGKHSDTFGSSVAISEDGKTALIGAEQNSGSDFYAGAAYIFDVTTGQQVAKLLASDGEFWDFFGGSVAISGDTALIGARGDDDTGYNAGAVYVFDVTTGLQTCKLLASDGGNYSSFGGSLAISGDTALIGALGDDDKGEEAGAAYVFDLGPPPPVSNVLANPGFEGGLEGWTTFGNAFHEVAAPPAIVPQSGSGLLKMFGNFSGGFNVSGAFQTFGAAEGQTFTLDAASRHFSGDSLQGSGPASDNWVVMKIAFFDAGGSEIAGAEELILDGSSPTDTWIDNNAVSGTAPAGTRTVQALLLYLQPFSDGGAAQIDDVVFSVVGPCNGQGATWTNYGVGHPGTNGAPSLTMDPVPVMGQGVNIVMGNSAGLDAGSILFFGTRQTADPTPVGGTLWTDIVAIFPTIVPAAGGALGFFVPNDSDLYGSEIYGQLFQCDAGASAGFSFSPGLRIIFGG